MPTSVSSPGITDLDQLVSHILADDGTRLVDRTLQSGNFPGGLTAPSFVGGVIEPVLQVLTASGAINIPATSGVVFINIAGVGALTLANPTAGVDDGKVIDVVSLTAQAHQITAATSGFNNKGASGTATYAAAIGNTVRLRAYQARWYATQVTGVTIA